jgi:hypothetical protein
MRESWDGSYRNRRLVWDGRQPARTWVREHRNVHCWKKLPKCAINSVTSPELRPQWPIAWKYSHLRWPKTKADPVYKKHISFESIAHDEQKGRVIDESAWYVVSELRGMCLSGIMNHRREVSPAVFMGETCIHGCQCICQSVRAMNLAVVCLLLFSKGNGYTVTVTKVSFLTHVYLKYHRTTGLESR